MSRRRNRVGQGGGSGGDESMNSQVQLGRRESLCGHDPVFLVSSSVDRRKTRGDIWLTFYSITEGFLKVTTWNFVGPWDATSWHALRTIPFQKLVADRLAICLHLLEWEATITFWEIHWKRGSEKEVRKTKRVEWTGGSFWKEELHIQGSWIKYLWVMRATHWGNSFKIWKPGILCKRDVFKEDFIRAQNDGKRNKKCHKVEQVKGREEHGIGSESKE